MIVVADSSPVIVLMNIQQIDLLRDLFGKVAIPQQVVDELSSPKRLQAVREFIASPPSWFEIHLPKQLESITGLQLGEIAAISLAKEINAERLIIDEKDGRRIATERGIRVIGTIGVLELAAEQNLIELEATFEKVKATDFWLPEGFLDERIALFRQRHPK
jgi:predicted nucleic acid-binding protein